MMGVGGGGRGHGWVGGGEGEVGDGDMWLRNRGSEVMESGSIHAGGTAHSVVFEGDFASEL